MRILLILTILVLSPYGASSAESEAVPNEIICRVNGEPIRRREVEERMPQAIVNRIAGLRQQLTDMGRTEVEAQESADRLLLPVFRQTLRDVVREKLMLQQATRDGLEVHALLVSDQFEREWDALKARDLAGKPGYEEKTVREQVYRRLLIQAFRRQPAISRDEETWFRDALERNKITDGDEGQPIDPSFFVPAKRPVKDVTAQAPIVVEPVEISEP